jgi:hypothetical protein
MLNPKWQNLCLITILIALTIQGCGGSSSGSSAAPTPDDSPAWGTAALIQPSGGIVLGSRNPQVTINANGKAVAVWQQWDGTRDNIRANYYVPGSGWAGGTPALLESSNNTAESPQIAMDDNGNAIAVWSQSDGAHYNIYANKFASGSWGSATTLSDTSGDATQARIVMNAMGNAFVVWQQDDGLRDNIWAIRSTTAGTSWGSATTIESTANTCGNPQIALDASGNAIAVWDQDEGTINIYANRYVSGTGWGNPTILISSGAGNTRESQITVTPNGDAIAIWTQNNSTTYCIWANSYISGTGWDTPAPLEAGMMGGDSSYPEVGLDNQGNALAVWYQQNNGLNNIWTSRYISGTGWDAAELLETGAGDAIFPHIAMAPDGTATVIWLQNNGSEYYIHARRYVAASGWGAIRIIEPTHSENSDYSDVAMNAHGEAVAVWMRCLDGTVWNIWANMYK